MIDRTLTVSVWSRTPGRKQQNPRMIKSNRQAGLRSFAQSLNQLRIFELIHLGDNSRRPTSTLVFCLPMNQFKQTRPHDLGRYQQGNPPGSTAVPGQVME